MCVCTHVFPRSFSTLFFVTRSLIEPGSSRFNLTFWPESPRSPPVPASPTLGLQVCTIVHGARDRIQVPVLGQHAFYPLSRSLPLAWCHSFLPVTVNWIKWNTQWLSALASESLLNLTVQDKLTSVKWQVIPSLLIEVGDTDRQGERKATLAERLLCTVISQGDVRKAT